MIESNWFNCHNCKHLYSEDFEDEECMETRVTEEDFKEIFHRGKKCVYFEEEYIME